MATRTLEQVLRQAGCAARASGAAVWLPSGLRLEAALLEARPLDDGRVATATRIIAFHDAVFAEGLPDVQHAIGADARQAMAAGFSAWAASARVTLEDAVRPRVRDCALLALKLAAPGEGAPALYQALLGPVVRRLGGQPAAGAEPAAEDDEPCPACMTTRIQDALGARLRADGYTGLSLFAGRDAAGALAADCRVNGEAFPEGVARLMAYARAWPARGFEFRQQYVIVRPAREPAAAGQ